MRRFLLLSSSLFLSLSLQGRSMEAGVSHQNEKPLEASGKFYRHIEPEFTKISSNTFNKSPTPGQDAFWLYKTPTLNQVSDFWCLKQIFPLSIFEKCMLFYCLSHNLENPLQKILLVPSHHGFNLRFVRPSLLKEIKKRDILVVEANEEITPWDDAEILKKAFHYDVEDLKKGGAIQDVPFKLSEPGLPEIKMWTDILAVDSSINLEDIKQSFNPILGGISIENVHPYLIANALMRFDRAKQHFFGMDEQIQRFFYHNRKIILTLETREELHNIVYGHSNAIASIARETIDLELLSKIGVFYNWIKNKLGSHNTQKDALLKLKETLKKYESEVEDRNHVSSRNRLLWWDKLKEYFLQYRDENIVVIPGAGHFFGKDGILSLLFESGYTSVPFEPEIPSEVHNYKKTVKSRKPTQEEERILQAEIKKKETTNAKVDEALGSFLPCTWDWESGKFLRDPSLIRGELINVLVGMPGVQYPDSWERLTTYIETRNEIYEDVEIHNKEKALDILWKNPLFNIVQVQSNAKVDEALKDFLPCIWEPGKPLRDPSSIRGELINAIIGMPAIHCPDSWEKLTTYIETRNKIYADVEIHNKEKALDILWKNPLFNIAEIKLDLK